jgi:cytochrome c oxidase cbb3-type subunit I/II
MWDPQSTSSGSIMPGYKWLFDNEPMDYSLTETKMKVMVKLGVPYSDEEIANAQQSIKEQAEQIEKNLHADPEFVKSYENAKKSAETRGEAFVPMSQREIIAMIAYLQRMGTDIKVKETAQKQ